MTDSPRLYAHLTDSLSRSSLLDIKVHRRSSLDRFLIPGRIRIPTLKPAIPAEFDPRVNHRSRQGVKKTSAVPTMEEDSKGRAQTSSTEAAPVREYGWFMRKVLRKSSSSQSVKVKEAKPVTRKLSVGKIFNGGHKDFLKDRCLEDVARIGGVSILILPAEYAAAHLAIPTAICATAAYLLEHGRTTPGIFRINGQSSTVNRIYQYYAHEFELAAKVSDPVYANVGPALLPSHVAYNIYDVASVFKKLLNGLPGGILGSLTLFKALQSINKDFHEDEELTESELKKLRAKMIAFAISGLTSEYRVSFICAILGLVAALGHEAENTGHHTGRGSQSQPNGEQLMGFRALSLVFAPLLVGELTDEIELQSAGCPGAPEGTKKQGRLRRSLRRGSSQASEATLLQMSGERYKMAGAVMEMLLVSWKDVVSQLGGASSPEPEGPAEEAVKAQERPGQVAESKDSESIRSVAKTENERPEVPATGTLLGAPAATAAGSVKTLVDTYQSRSRDASESSEEKSGERAAAKMSALTRKNSVREAAQKFEGAVATKGGEPREKCRKTSRLPKANVSPAKSRPEPTPHTPLRVPKKVAVPSIFAGNEIPARTSSRSMTPSKLELTPVHVTNTSGRYQSTTITTPITGNSPTPWSTKSSGKGRSNRSDLNVGESWIPLVLDADAFDDDPTPRISNRIGVMKAFHVTDTPSKKKTSEPGDTKLHSEIRRLSQEFDKRCEEKKELETVRASTDIESLKERLAQALIANAEIETLKRKLSDALIANAQIAPLKEQLKEARREACTWKRRADWAEQSITNIEMEMKSILNEFGPPCGMYGAAEAKAGEGSA